MFHGLRTGQRYFVPAQFCNKISKIRSYAAFLPAQSLRGSAAIRPMLANCGKKRRRPLRNRRLTKTGLRITASTPCRLRHRDGSRRKHRRPPKWPCWRRVSRSSRRFVSAGRRPRSGPFHRLVAAASRPWRMP